jgi:oligopeptide transport system ATP-binding protein
VKSQQRKDGNTLEVEGLTKTFVTKRSALGRPAERLTAVDSVGFEIAPGETVALVGESGSGKSTVGRLVLRLLEPDSGSVRLHGDDISRLGRKDLAKARAKARMIFQDPFLSLDPRLSIASSLSESLRLHTDLSSAARTERVIELLRSVGLNESHRDRYPHQFSGGQLQRVAIARAIATEPDFVVCDEPTAALDMSVRAQVINLLQEKQEQLGLSYLFISHDLSLVRYIATRVLVMYRGSIIEAGKTEEIFEDPQHHHTKALLAAVPRIDGSRRHARPSRD